MCRIWGRLCAQSFPRIRRISWSCTLLVRLRFPLVQSFCWDRRLESPSALIDWCRDCSRKAWWPLFLLRNLRSSCCTATCKTEQSPACCSPGRRWLVGFTSKLPGIASLSRWCPIRRACWGCARSITVQRRSPKSFRRRSQGTCAWHSEQAFPKNRNGSVFNRRLQGVHLLCLLQPYGRHPSFL